jgi:hypothetical protein
MELTDLHKEIVIECSNDDVGLWSILWRINGGGYSVNVPLAKGIREKAIEIIRDLLEGRLIEGGFPQLPEHIERKLRELQAQNPKQKNEIFELIKNNPPTWKPLNYSVNDTINYIQHEWDSLDQDPNIGDIIWFRATPAGQQLAQTFSGE